MLQGVESNLQFMVCSYVLIPAKVSMYVFETGMAMKTGVIQGLTSINKKWKKRKKKGFAVLDCIPDDMGFLMLLLFLFII